MIPAVFVAVIVVALLATTVAFASEDQRGGHCDSTTCPAPNVCGEDGRCTAKPWCTPATCKGGGTCSGDGTKCLGAQCNAARCTAKGHGCKDNKCVRV